jgi:hypothetical protein
MAGPKLLPHGSRREILTHRDLHSIAQHDRAMRE